MINDKFIIAAALLHVVGSATYIIHTLQGWTKPNRVSWFMWAFVAFVAFAAQIHEEVGIQALMTFIVGFSPLLIFLATFVNKKAYWKLTKFDFICGLLSLVGISLWVITGEGSTAIAFAIAGDIFAGIPTFRKAFLYPETESYFLYFTGTVFSVVTLMTIDNWNFATYGFPLYIFIACFYLLLMVRYRLGLKLLKVIK